jgi:hypothetical protein
MDNIALIGHSRGGEAVAIAACFNRLPSYPDDASVAFNFNFNLRSVIAIAPVDGQYKPAKSGTAFENVSYFVIQGSNDMDLRTYDGSRQFQRIRFTDEAYHIKAGLYIFGANHGQFNSIWGRDDNTFPFMAIFNKRQIIPEEEQVTIGKVFISAFLEATLKGNTKYYALFRDYRSGIKWLPETIYLNQFEDTKCEFVCTFEEDINVQTTTLEGGTIQAENLTVWKEKVVPLKWGGQDTRAVYAGWNLDETDSLPGVLNIHQPVKHIIETGENSYLYFTMADAKENSNPYPDGDGQTQNGQMDHEKTSVEDKKEPLDLTVVLVDSAGNSAKLPLSSYSFLSRQLVPKLMKADFMTDVAKSDLVFQAFFFPLENFRKQNDKLEITRIHEIRFVFDRSEEGVVVIDNIGFWQNI